MCRCSSQANKESFSSISCLFGYDPFPINAENFSQSSSLYISKMRNPDTYRTHKYLAKPFILDTLI